MSLYYYCASYYRSYKGERVEGVQYRSAVGKSEKIKVLYYSTYLEELIAGSGTQELKC